MPEKSGNQTITSFCKNGARWSGGLIRHVKNEISLTAPRVGGSNLRRSSFSFRRRDAYGVLMASMKTDKSGCLTGGLKVDKTARREKRAKVVQKWNKA